MNTEDKIYQKIQKASEKLPNHGFSGMDKVWLRVEEKLDNHVLRKENNRWKKFSIAATVAIVGTLVYLFLHPKNTIVPHETVVTVDTLQPILTEPEEAIVTNEKNESVEEKETILQKAIERPKLVMAEKVIIKNDTYSDEEPTIVNDEKVLSEIITQGYQVSQKVSESVKTDDKDKLNFAPETRAKRSELQSNFTVSTSDETGNKLPPLVIINGQKSKVSELKNIPKEELEAVIVLNDPIYIINGVMYTEQELFGPNPTSPYAPLHKQDIISTTILQEEDALKTYGEKGKKGVVIIKTKEGKPKK